MRLDDVLELTPKTIWYLFERSYELIAQGRLMLVEDLSAVEAPAQLQKGLEVRNEHIRMLRAQAGFHARAGYTAE